MSAAFTAVVLQHDSSSDKSKSGSGWQPIQLAMQVGCFWKCMEPHFQHWCTLVPLSLGKLQHAFVLNSASTLTLY